MKIGFDFDGVICDTHHIYRGHFFDCFGHVCEQPHNQKQYTFDIIDNEFYEPDWWREIPVAIVKYQHICPPFPGAIEALKAFADSIDEICIVTAREDSDAVRQVTNLWCHQNFDFAFDIHYVGTPEDKDETLQRLGITHFVDDRFKTAVHIAEFINTSFILNQPWNRRRDKVPGNVIRIDSLWEMKALLDVAIANYAGEM
jgi:uncharacterized HAD superfamily protein